MNYEEGNPFLKPSFSNEAEINYSFKSKLFISIFYGQEDRSATNIILQDAASKTTITTFGNLAKAQDGGVTISYSEQLLPWLNSNNFVGLFFNRFKGPYLGGYLDVFKPTFNINSVNTFTISNNLKAEVGINYLSSQQQGLLLVDNIGVQVNPGIQKMILSGLGVIKMSVSDLLKVRNWNYSTRFEQIDTKYQSNRDSRRLTVSFSYRFGKQSVKQERKRKTGTDDEQSRS